MGTPDNGVALRHISLKCQDVELYVSVKELYVEVTYPSYTSAPSLTYLMNMKNTFKFDNHSNDQSHTQVRVLFLLCKQKHQCDRSHVTNFRTFLLVSLDCTNSRSTCYDSTYSA